MIATPTPSSSTTPSKWPDVEVERVLWGWKSFRHPRPEIVEHHFIPLMDIGAHLLPEHGGEGCPCGAFEDMPGSIIHNAYDGREAYEPLGGRKRH